MRSKKIVLLFLAVFFLFTPLVFGFWTKFVSSVQNFDVTLGSLESSKTDFTISFDPAYPYGAGKAPYYIASDPHCDGYNENGECMNSIPNLCPYLSLTPKDGEVTETGFTQNSSGQKAFGELDRLLDETDTWNLSVKSPCFEGECPANYDSSKNGVPLSPTLKGQTFKCDLSINASDFPDLVKNNFDQNVAYADTSLDTIEVSAVLTGEVKGCMTDCFSNVLFLPGIEASRLYTRDTGGNEKQLWEPHGNIDVEGLYLNTDGTSKDPKIYARDIIKEANTPISLGLPAQDVYKSFSDMMDGLVADNKITEWKPFAYDWRQGVDDIISNGTKYQNGNISLVNTLQSLVDSSKNGKVTIIAHSNGGLLAKALLKKLQDDKNAGKNNLIDDVDVLILVASPEIGTASAVPAVMHGFGQSMGFGLLVDEMHARELGRNAPFAFGLLPSKEYINRVSASPVTFVDNLIPSNITTKLVQAFGSAINSYDEYKGFLFGSEGRTIPAIDQMNLPIDLSPSLFFKAETLHNNIDVWTPPADLRVIEIAGWGLDTVASYEYYPLLINPEALDHKFIMDEAPRFTSDGDGVVVVPSAQYVSSLDSNVEKYWVDLYKYNNSNVSLSKKEHGNILEIKSLLNFSSNIIQNLSISGLAYISNSKPIDNSNRLRLSIHSPVTIDAYDSSGNHTGKICPQNSDLCYVEENIPNSSYLEFGEGKYLNLPEDQLSKVKLQGTDVGTFTYDSEKVLPNGTSTLSSFVDIPVTTQTEAEITLNPTTKIPQLALDVTGDGVVDFTLAPSTTFDPIAYLKIMRATIDSLDLSKAKIRDFDNRVDNIVKLIQKGKIDKAKLKVDRFKSVLEKKLAKSDPKHPRFKRISKTDAQLLLDMLNKLLDNLN